MQLNQTTPLTSILSRKGSGRKQSSRSEPLFGGRYTRAHAMSFPLPSAGEGRVRGISDYMEYG